MVSENLSPDAWAGVEIGRVAAPVRDQVLEIVRQAILDFKLPPGQRLIERELVEELGVSRTTVRDVLARLAVEGLVTNIPQKGAIVSVLTRQEAVDIYEMRASLEALAVRRFAERASEEEMEGLRATLPEIHATARASDPAAALRAKDRFYEVLLAGAGSPRLRTVLAGLQGQVRFLRAISLSAPDRPVEAANEIERIVEAVAARDADGAAAACMEHVRKAAAVGVARLGQSGGESRDSSAASIA